MRLLKRRQARSKNDVPAAMILACGEALRMEPSLADIDGNESGEPDLQLEDKRPLSEGGDAFDLDNVAVLCHGCHVLRHHPDAKLPDAKLGRKLSDWKRFARVVK